MKTINRIFTLAGIAACLGLVSCNSLDLTTPTKSSTDESMVFSNYTLAEYNVYSIYEVLGHTNCHRARYLCWYGINTDTEIYVSTSAGSKSEIARYAITTNNDQLNLSNGPYTELFTGVERANLTIKGIRTYGNIDSDPDMAALYGEALTARAFLYAELLKAYGEVPGRFEPIGPETMYMPKSDRDDIYRQLLSDLEEAIPYLPQPNAGRFTGVTTRASKAFAEGLYARLALYACGYALRPDEGKVNTGNPGTVRTSPYFQEHRQEYYSKALGYLQDVISNSGLSLYEDFEQLWRDFNNFDTAAGKEVIFSIPFSDSRGRWNKQFAVKNDTQTKWADATRGGDVGPVPTVYWRYGEGDQRRDVSCANFRFKRVDGEDKAVVSKAGEWFFGKYRFDWMEKEPYTSGKDDDGAKPVYMRLADIYLMASEIANELGDLAAAKSYMEPVVKRAYRNDAAKVNAYMSTLTDQAKMFDAVVDQRGLEFVGEMLRKADLIRWNLLGTKLQEAKAEMQALTDHVDYNGLKFSELGKTVYYKYAADGYNIVTWGFNPGETSRPEGAGWEEYLTDKGETTESYFELSDEKINSLFDNDPDTYQWWPIPDTIITTSQGSLVNDYQFN